MNKELLGMVLPEPTEDYIRELCRSKKEELGFDIEKALFPINPLHIEPSIELAEAVKLCEEWNSIRNSVWVSEWFKLRGSIQDSIWNSIRDSESYSIWNSILDSESYSVWGSVRDSVWGSVKGLICDSLKVSVWKGELLRSSIQDSIRDSIEAYTSTIFFNVEFEHDLSSVVKLWESGYIASFDGEKWRLHTHKGVVWTGEFK